MLIVESTWPRLPLLPGVVNRRPKNVPFYIVLGNAGHAVANFLKSRVWDKIPERRTVIFGDMLMTLKHSVG